MGERRGALVGRVGVCMPACSRRERSRFWCADLHNEKRTRAEGRKREQKATSPVQPEGNPELPAAYVDWVHFSLTLLRFLSLSHTRSFFAALELLPANVPASPR